MLTENINLKKKTKKNKRDKFKHNELKKYIDMKGNWELINHIDHQALSYAYSDLNECLEFIKKLKNIILLEMRFILKLKKNYQKIENIHCIKKYKNSKIIGLFGQRKVL